MNLLTRKEKRKYVGFELPIEQAIIVPSTMNADKPITRKELRRRTREVDNYLSKTFGGFTQAKASGGYYSTKKHKLISEPVNVVTSFSTKKAFVQNREKLLKKLSCWGKRWGQESMGYELQNDLFYIKRGSCKR